MKETKKRERVQLNRNKIAALMFVLVLLVFCGVNLAVKDKNFSEKENRMLEQKPEFTIGGLESGRFMEQYESYQSDQFAGRNLWVSLKTNVELLSGKRESNGVFKGKDHYLLEDIKTPNEEQMQENLTAMKEFADAYPDVPTYVMLVPNAANVLADRLPAYAVTRDQDKDFAQIQEQLGSSVTWVDAKKALSAQEDEELYYHTDHHWTTMGAYYAYQELAAVMGLDTSKAPKMEPYAVSNSFNGTLSATSGYESGYEEPMYIYAPEDLEAGVQVVVTYENQDQRTATLYDQSKLEEKDKYAMFLGGNYSMVDIRTTADTTDRLLVIKDSYANCFIPFLTSYYREIIIIDPRYYYGDIKGVMTDSKINSVLYLYNGNTFVEDNSISGVLQDGETE